MMKQLATIASTAVAAAALSLGLAYGTGHLTLDAPAQGPAAAVAAPQEDEPGWDCTTMGNRRCGPAAPSTAQGRLNLNTATAAELDELPGIGAKLAARIVAFRQAHPFTSTAQLTEVPHLPTATAAQLAALVTV